MMFWSRSEGLAVWHCQPLGGSVGHSSLQVYMGPGPPRGVILVLTKCWSVLKDSPEPTLNKHEKQKRFLGLPDAFLLGTQVPQAWHLWARGYVF